MSDQANSHECTQDELSGIHGANLGGPVVVMMTADLTQVLGGEVIDNMPDDPGLASALWAQKTAGIKRYYPADSVAIRGDLAGNLITFHKTEEV
ncbi:MULTISPECIES: hypothetical protein [unclassified Leisingera]|uniref:hypothetical protein n=1 Tax=unclassified Leisingera TaxID=2614906 RepID=UPI001013BE54|nr:MULTISPECIES: hypothetical protein [unclassified Leisingera]MCF6433428.1 hypothetical protein [Leisingera sp. MMG026]QAX32407.1 hypothetical protein ETW24_23785 [Leisingera sp. NJS204]